MNVLILGGGGREHALAWKIAQSHHCNKLFVAPGNPGIAQVAIIVDMGTHDFEGIKSFCLLNKIDVLVVGPEEPLVNGIYDFMEKAKTIDGWRGFVVGPSKAAAQLEGSKAFSKKFMQRHDIPTAAYAEFTKDSFEAGKQYIQQHTLPIVLKADGLAAGKGVVISETHEDALQVFEQMLINRQFGEASTKVVIEEFLTGIEVSVFVLTNGVDYKIIGHAKDYKRIGEGDTGLNTGGMGCVTPVPFITEAFMQQVEEKIIAPTVKGLLAEGLVYNGFIFFGLMNEGGNAKVIEYNCRMGDPETEVVLPRLDTDLLSLFAAMDNGTLEDTNINFADGYFATVMAVSGGYPGNYKKNIPITGADKPLQVPGSLLFHAGTRQEGKAIVTNGGRVLAVTSKGESIGKAVQQSLDVLGTINFEGMYYRRDIGFEFS
ncbi:phosphoribosylamine--glycine ligase [Parasediminibacterium sp. JCM 36343]|uniref:phosphoribosylamine--glycine ligase n=1 Tax=Parasediminibacterium sp. JCM 36343 TaxID=3374279 RepID=UPI00397AEFE1